MLKTIVITWTNADSWSEHYQETFAALWIAEGTDADLNEALHYVQRYHRNESALVHTFAPSEPQWKAKAIAAHLNGYAA
jgi:hypothetical protein